MIYETAPEVIARAIKEQWETVFPDAPTPAEGKRVQMAHSIVAALAHTGVEIVQHRTIRAPAMPRGVDTDLWGGD
jgi:hypothetical protein